MSKGVQAPMLVVKFGGTSVGDAEAVWRSAAVVAGLIPEWPRLVVVLSAMAGVTNGLLRGIENAVAGDLETCRRSADELLDRHLQVLEGLVREPADLGPARSEIENLAALLTNLFQAISVLGEATPRAIDSVTSVGERMSVRLFTAVLQSMNLAVRAVDASDIIITDAQFQSAHPEWRLTRQKTRELLLPLLDAGVIPVVTGFMAATPQGVITTLGRGGSDYSAAILGTALPADEVWIWTDVDGVMTADPRLVPEARTISTLSYREVAELAYFGAKVLHPKTIRPVIEAGIGLRVRNTFRPDHPGTLVVAEPGDEDDGTVKAVTAIRSQKLITIEGRGMLGVPGVAARAFGAVAATGTSVILITQASSEQSICFSVPAEATSGVLAALEKTFTAELAQRDIDRIWATEETVIITVVGSGLRHTPGVAGRVFSALGAQGVNVMAIAQGSSEVAISMVVRAADLEASVLSLHELILEDNAHHA